MSTQSDEFIYNWSNQLAEGTARERRASLVRLAQQHRNRGFSRNEALELLVADTQDIDTCHSVVDYVFADVEEEKPAVQAYLVPTSYRDVAAQVEGALARLGPDEFIDAICGAEYPIVRTSRRGRESLRRVAENALVNPKAMDMLHETIAPYFETAMLDSVILAEQSGERVAQVDDSVFVVGDGNEQVQVDLESGSSTGYRYKKGRFAEFGLADEYMVRVAEHASPHERLRRAVQGA